MAFMERSKLSLACCFLAMEEMNSLSLKLEVASDRGRTELSISSKVRSRGRSPSMLPVGRTLARPGLSSLQSF